MKKERILGPISMPCFVTMLEAPFLLPQAARVLGEEASLASSTPRPAPLHQRGSYWQKLSSWW